LPLIVRVIAERVLRAPPLVVDHPCSETKMDWIDVGGGFGPEDNPVDVQKLLHNAELACRVLNSAPFESRRETNRSRLFLVLENDPTADEDTVSRVEEEGVRGPKIFVLSRRWITSEFLDEERGPWRILGILSLVLADLHEAMAIQLPLIPPRRDATDSTTP
jgi:hypothetical protein